MGWKRVDKCCVLHLGLGGKAEKEAGLWILSALRFFWFPSYGLRFELEGRVNRHRCQCELGGVLVLLRIFAGAFFSICTPKAAIP